MRPPEPEQTSMQLPKVSPLQNPHSPSTGLDSSQSIERLSKVASLASLSPESPSSSELPLSSIRPLPSETGPQRILDFDVETINAGFDDPDWTPQKITCVAWSWIGEEDVHSRICGPEGLFTQPDRRRRMVAALVDQIRQADMLTGHNIYRFDLPIVNAECMRLGLEPLRAQFVQDTMWLKKAKGFKKGQDNLGLLTHIDDEKFALNWQAWQDAYSEEGWKLIRHRAESDVHMHKQLRERLISSGWLKNNGKGRRWLP